MTLTPVPPVGLLAPIVITLENVKICESGNYPDKFGQIHRYQFFQWVMNFKDYIPILLEHQPFTWPFFGYLYALRVDGEDLNADLAFTRYGLEALIEYKERHMGSGWSVGVLEGKKGLGEVTLCRRPRVSTTHVITLDSLSLDGIGPKKYGLRDDSGKDSDIGDQVVGLVREIIDHEARGSETMAADAMKRLQELMYCNNIHIPDDDEEETK